MHMHVQDSEEKWHILSKVMTILTAKLHTILDEIERLGDEHCRAPTQVKQSST